MKYEEDLWDLLRGFYPDELTRWNKWSYQAGDRIVPPSHVHGHTRKASQQPVTRQGILDLGLSFDYFVPHLPARLPARCSGPTHRHRMPCSSEQTYSWHLIGDCTCNPNPVLDAVFALQADDRVLEPSDGCDPLVHL